MNKLAAFQLINEAIKYEQENKSFYHHLQHLLADPRQLPIAQHCDEPQVYSFVIDYITVIPRYFSDLTRYSEQTHIHCYVLPLLNIAKDYFIKAKPISDDRYSITAIINETYFCHRIMEEINERIMSRCGQAFIPADTTTANLIIHQLIGEPFVNEIDEGVEFAIQQADETRLNILSEHSVGDLIIDLNWPDFCQQHHIEFDPLVIGQLNINSSSTRE